MVTAVRVDQTRGFPDACICCGSQTDGPFVDLLSLAIDPDGLQREDGSPVSFTNVGVYLCRAHALEVIGAFECVSREQHVDVVQRLAAALAALQSERDELDRLRERVSELEREKQQAQAAALSDRTNLLHVEQRLAELQRPPIPTVAQMREQLRQVTVDDDEPSAAPVTVAKTKPATATRKGRT
jgi:hypothetical protein